MPHGFGAVIAAMLTTMFTFMGTEIVTIAAAESPDPEQRHPQGRQLGDLADQPVLPGLDLRGRRPRRLELPGLVERGSYQYVLDQIGLDNLAPCSTW